MHQLNHKPMDRYMGEIISTDQWRSWEMKRWILENETPGLHGYFEGKAAS